MPALDPDISFDNFVYPDYYDWTEDPTNLRLAFHSANSCYAITEHYYGYHSTKGDRARVSNFSDLSIFRKYLGDKIVGWNDIYAMSLAFKHYRLGAHGINTAGAVYLLTYSGNKIFSKWDDVNHDGKVVIERNDGEEVAVGDALDNIISFWTQLLLDRGVMQ
jgi:hypothetical protein